MAEGHQCEIKEVNVAPDHVHISLSLPPRYSITHVLGVLKSISVAGVFEKFPEVKKKLCEGEFLEDRYFTRTVGDKPTVDLIKRQIRYHPNEIHG